jgi:hypothetical protein
VGRLQIGMIWIELLVCESCIYFNEVFLIAKSIPLSRQSSYSLFKLQLCLCHGDFNAKVSKEF